LLKGKIGDKEENWRLADCKCELKDCKFGGLTLTEKIPAKSLNSLFSNTVQYYFSMLRSGSANSFNTFYTCKSSRNIHSSMCEGTEYLSKVRREFVLSRIDMKNDIAITPSFTNYL